LPILPVSAALGTYPSQRIHRFPLCFRTVDVLILMGMMVRTKILK
jgi:hypothetical protein